MPVNLKGIAALILVLALGLLVLGRAAITEPRHVDSGLSFNTALWEYRGFDVLGQVMLLLAASFGIVMLLREESPHG
jgi:multisubunit Na+/H+ antiporter MnhB subunit